MSAEVFDLSPRLPVRMPRAHEITPEVAERVGAIAQDWLFELCSREGKAKLLEQHELLAA